MYLKRHLSKFLLSIVTIFCGINLSFASVVKIQAGDILLQPLHCYLCSLIESETNSIYSHIGIVASVDQKLVVFEAYSKVVPTPLDLFLAKTQKNQKVKVLRSLSQINTEKLNDDFFENFNGHQYDSEFLWDNVDEFNNSKIYCSELVSKLLSLQNINITPKPMSFDQNYEAWTRYFQKLPPTGELGLAPADFDNHFLFETVGEI